MPKRKAQPVIQLLSRIPEALADGLSLVAGRRGISRNRIVNEILTDFLAKEAGVLDKSKPVVVIDLGCAEP